MSTLIQHPIYSDWGLPCPRCGGFIALPDTEAQRVYCGNCGLELGEEPLAAIRKLASLRFSMSITGEVSAIEPTREKMTAIMRQCGCSEEDMQEVSLALQEALANAVLHGCRGDASRQICCSIECNAREVAIMVQDPGSGFNEAAVRDCASPEGLLSSNGRGIAMMRGLMDEVIFENGGALVRMRRLFPKARPQGAASKSRQ